MTVKFDLMVGNGSYQKDGQTKTSWLRVGRIIETTTQRLAMKLDCLPTTVQNKNGDIVPWDGWVQLFPAEAGPSTRREAPQRPSAPQKAWDDDFPPP